MMMGLSSNGHGHRYGQGYGEKGGGGAGDGTKGDGEWVAAVDEWATQHDGGWSTETRDGR